MPGATNLWNGIRSGCLRLMPYGGAALLLTGLAHSGITESVDLLIYDGITSLKPITKAKQQPITIIGISEKDIAHYGWPINDSVLCQVIRNASKAGATAIGIDLYRDQGVGTQRECLSELVQSDPKVISIFNAAEDIRPIPGTPANQQAFNDLIVDSDGVIRRDLVHVRGQDEATVAFPMRLAEIAQGDSTLRSKLDRQDASTTAQPWLEPRSGGYRGLDAAGYQRMLPFLPAGSFTTLTLQETAEARPSSLRKALNKQIVLIGSTAPSLKDLFEIPSSRFTNSTSQLRIPGVEVHALRTAALLKENTVSPWPVVTASAKLNHAIEALAILIGIGLGEAFKTLRRSIVVVAVGTTALGATLAGLLWYGGLWTGIAFPVQALPLMAAVGWLRRGAISQIQRQQIQRLLGQTTSPAVAEQLWQQRDELLADGRFQGRQLPVTVLFSDTCNFTTVSEQLAPSDLLDWLNRGMALLVPAITRRGGMVNKFTGDGMLAVFGAPLSNGASFDAKAALEAGAEIQQALEKLNHELAAEGAPAMHMRIGVHSGTVLAGSMGSTERLEYAVIGDAVNCASRLESYEKNRQTNICRILVSSATRSLYDSPSLHWEPWGDVHVKGRHEPLSVSELKGIKSGSE